MKGIFLIATQRNLSQYKIEINESGEVVFWSSAFAANTDARDVMELLMDDFTLRRDPATVRED